MNNIDEAIHLVEHDERWAERFVHEQRRVASALSISNDCIEHIGSTAVVGLPAKPVVDLMVGVEVWPLSDDVSDKLCRLGYEALGEAGVPERWYFRLRGSLCFNVHVVRLGGQHWRTNIALRNYLRSSKSARERYADAKRQAVSSGAVTLLAYSDAKASTIMQLVNEALSSEKHR